MGSRPNVDQLGIERMDDLFAGFLRILGGFSAQANEQTNRRTASSRQEAESTWNAYSTRTDRIIIDRRNTPPPFRGRPGLTNRFGRHGAKAPLISRNYAALKGRSSTVIHTKKRN